MHSNQRIKRKIPFLSKKPDPKKEDMLDITPISLKRHEMKLPLITSKMTPKRDISIEFKPSLKKKYSSSHAKYSIPKSLQIQQVKTLRPVIRYL